jgi:predicted house-cleaning noncanonical NTP pyrophosphatase (MazG superfamily)
MKLVRDKIVDIINASGKACVWRKEEVLDKKVLLLRDKIIEESDEFIETPCIEEAADILEVLMSLCELYDIHMVDIFTAANRKRTERGGFERFIVLESVEGNNIA